MRKKTEELALRLSKGVAASERIQAVLLCEASESDILDPYFSLVLDVYYDGALPTAAARKASYGAVDALESSDDPAKDRFLADGLPVRVEYKRVDDVKAWIRLAKAGSAVGREIGTYVFYRLANSRVLFDRNAWIESARGDCADFPAEFWRAMRSVYQPKMEHHLEDLAAATMTKDGFFRAISLGGFLRNAALTLLMINRRFEPSTRVMSEQLAALERLPEGFRGRWDTLVRENGGPADRAAEVARLLAAEIVKM